MRDLILTVILRSTAFVVAIPALVGCQAAMYGTAADFNRIRLGMTKQEVIAVVGEPITIGADAGTREERLVYRKMAYTLGWSPTLYDVVLSDGKVIRFGAQP